jgi:transcriptional regulator with XRE-family HTH domain
MRKTEKEMTDNPIVLRILDELKIQRKTESEMEKALGLSNGTFTRWKYMNGKTYMNHISKIAKYLNVTEDYLLEEKEMPFNRETLSSTEIRLVMMYRKLDKKRRKCLMETAEYFMYSIKNNNSEKETTKTSRDESNSDENLLS